MTIWLLLFVLLLDRGASKTALLDDGTCPAGWDSMGDVCLQPHLEPKETVEAAKHCRKKGAKLLECPVVLDDVIELLSSLFEKGIEESTWLIAPREEGPIALRRSANGSYNILNLPSVATFPFLCSLTPVGRRSALLQQQLTARGAPQLHWNTPREIYFHARPDADFIPLPCRVTAQPPARIIWFKNDLQIISGNDSLLVSGGTLLVPATSSLAYSTFHCIGTNKYGKVRSPSVVLKPAFIEPFPPNRQDAVPLAHGGARLQCQTAHQPKSQSFTWLLGSTNRPVLTDERVFISREGSLLFANVGPDDDARYACFLSLSSTASGHYGPFFRLRVLSPQPQFKPRIDPSYPLIFPENAVAGDTIYVECFAYANPVAMYSWNRVDGKPFSPRVTVTNHGRVLRIDKAQRSDAGRLRCSTTNSLGASTAEINLVLKGPAPVILLPLTDLVVATEEDFSLECVLSSSDLYSSVEWFKDGTPVVPLLMPPSQRKRFKVNENKLSVISVQALDTGTYQCVIGNDVGVTTSSAHVSVKDVVPNFPATVMPQKVFANIGSNVSIPCIYQASPRGHSRWTSDGGARIPSKGRVREEDGTLFIDHVLPDDQGHFFCIARNRIGRANSQVQLIVVETTLKKNRPWTGNFSCEIEWECKDKACQDFKDAETKKKLPCSSALGAASALLPAPIGLRVENMTHGLRLAWRMPPHGRETRDHQKNDVKGFLVEMRTKDDRQWKAAPRGVVKATDADGLLLEDLVSNQQYQFRIRSVGTSFVGDASSPSSWVKTPASPPQESVEDLRWKALDPTRLLIEWEPLDEQAGDNLRYVVSWSEAAQHDPAPTFFAHRVESNLPQTVIRLNSTNGCRAVTLAVRAENDQGTADVSTETVALVRGAGHPGRLTEEAVEVLNATHIRLSWKWSDAGDCAAPRVVKISCDSEGQATVNLTTSGENSEWVVGNLHPSTDYNCFLTPSDTSGHQGETTNPLVLRTMVAPPSEAPLIIDWALKPSDKHDFTTVLEWRAVDHGNDTVENCGYDIFVFISETANEAVILRMPLVKLTDHQKPSARIDGLRLMYLYTIQVSAYNSGGQGPRSTPRVIRLGSRRDELSNASHISVIFILIFCLCQ